jgi:ABC-type transport system involved in cytochrome c biogenesis permease component
MEIFNLTAGCASGLVVGYLDQLMLWNTVLHTLYGRKRRGNSFIRYCCLVRLPIAGVFFYIFLAVLHVSIAGFLSGLAISSIIAFLQAVTGWQKLTERIYVGNS